MEMARSISTNNGKYEIEFVWNIEVKASGSLFILLFY